MSAPLLPYTQLYAGTILATAIHQTAHKWPVYFSGTAGVHIIYDDRIFYDQAITYDGLMLPSDVTLTVAPTWIQPPVGDTRVRPDVGDTRPGGTTAGPTRWGRRKQRALSTRVTRRTMLAVAPTRTAPNIGMTRRAAMIGPTRVQRGK